MVYFGFEGDLRGSMKVRIVETQLFTVGALNGKFSGMTRVKLKLPFLYGELDLEEGS
jgi:hypothetical protein